MTGRVVCTFLAALVAHADGPVQVDYGRDIQPLFARHCYSCHGPEKQNNGLRLDRRAAALKGGDSGPAIIPGKATDSRLYRYIAGLDPDMVMPVKGERLAEPQVEVIRRWINEGAGWPTEDTASNSSPGHWAFERPRRPAVPRLADATWARNPIDAFIGEQLERRQMRPAPEAARPILIRRLKLDLIGLPPAPAEIEGFLADRSADAYERLVERYLASPHYGERWGRHWLDLARWAETEGYEGNTFRASAWRYRDWVVRSFNQDKAYDRFLREQIAGDEVTPYADDNLIATGFLSGARYSHNEEDKAIQRNDVLIDIVNATAGVTLGLTLACAQCHDHKFDALTLRDYYRFQAFFVRGQLTYSLLKDPAGWRAYEKQVPPDYTAAKQLRAMIREAAQARLRNEARARLSPDQLAALELTETGRTDAQREAASAAQAALQITEEAIEKALTDDDRRLVKELDKKIGAHEKELREKKPQMWAFYSPATSPHPVEMLPPKGDFPLPYEAEKLKRTEARVYLRGDVHRPGAAVEPGWPEIFGPTPPAHAGESPRMMLVNWLVSETNPLTARVWVNYIWQQHFGRGIVRTAGDFGVRGTPPTHPALLDWLATELIRCGWRTKQIHRLIVLSHTYRQASRAGAQDEARQTAQDPENVYYGRWQPRRLEAEAIHDATLFVSGELNPALGGPSIPREEEDRRFCRTIYLRQKRDDFPRAQALFDGPNANESCFRRHVSTVPLQALHALNSEFSWRRAQAFAARVAQLAGPDPQPQARLAFWTAWGRPPTADEEEWIREFRGGLARESPFLPLFCQALLNANEFVYVP